MMHVIAAPGPNKDTRTTLKGLTLTQLQDWAASIGEPPYRGAQLFDWLYGRSVSDPQLMDNLPRSLRRRLAEEYRLQTATITKVTVSSLEPTRKYLLTLAGGTQVETVSMLAGDRHTVCLSSQAGCNVGCGFCATAALGLQRNLTTGEMMDQLLLVQQERNIKATNVVFMGMGEPFLNYPAVLAAADIIHHPKGVDLGSQRITISTAGVVPKIERLASEDRSYRLAISINATNDEVRSQLMPINDTWPLERLMAAARSSVPRPISSCIQAAPTPMKAPLAAPSSARPTRRRTKSSRPNTRMIEAAAERTIDGTHTARRPIRSDRGPASSRVMRIPPT